MFNGVTMKQFEQCGVCGGQGKLIRGEYLRHVRLNQNLTLSDIAKKAGVSIVYLSDIERGNRRPTNKIMKFYGIDAR